MPEEHSSTITSHTIQTLQQQNAKFEKNVIELQQQMIELQVEYTYQQDHIRILDQVIIELRTHIESLQKNISMLEEKLNTSQQESTHFNVLEEKPPHY